MRKFFLGFSVLFFVQGCSDSEVEAPKISGESAFYCKDLNGFYADGADDSASRVLSSSYRQVSESYTENTAIQEFYRRTVSSSNADTVDLVLRVRSGCMSSPSSSIPDVITDSINKRFKEISDKPGLATCKSINDGLISFEDVVGHVGSLVGSLELKALRDPRYGPDYFKEDFLDGCEKKPGNKALDTLLKVISPVGEALYEESMSKLKEDSERDLRSSIESDLLRVSPDLLSKDLASCKEFVGIVNRENHAGYGEIHEEYAEKFAAVLHETVRKIDPKLTPVQKEKFDSLRESQIDGLVEGIYKVCESSWFNSHGSDVGELELAVMQVEEVSSAKSARELEAISLYEEKSRMNNCPRTLRDSEYCEAQSEQDAAGAAHAYVAECDKSGDPGEGLCALSVGEIYEYNLLIIRKEQLSKDVQRIGDYLLDPKKKNYNAEFYIRDLAEECGRKGVDAGLRGPEYGSYYDEKCLPAATEEFLKEDRLKLSAAEGELKKVELALAKFSSQ